MPSLVRIPIEHEKTNFFVNFYRKLQMRHSKRNYPRRKYKADVTRRFKKEGRADIKIMIRLIGFVVLNNFYCFSDNICYL